MAIISLPIELQEQILAYLTWDDHFRCSLVCKLWKNIIGSNKKIRNSWYLASAKADSNTALHQIFLMNGVECVFNIDGFKIRFGKVDASKDGDCRESGLMGYNSHFLDDPVFIVPSADLPVDRRDFDLYVRVTGCGAAEVMSVPWEHLDGVDVDGEYVQAPLRSFIQFLGMLAGPEFGLEFGLEYRVKFQSYLEGPPWMLGMKVADTMNTDLSGM
ncbi:hypothetical protein ABW19_dt0201014 [Dactylella cylindrospora]|nr:hypothetical protein ABW19_dt0201014 [Dactylella cylindrospora]